ncbi:uncharacterized protein LOC112881191 [Panicum hallii]|uniref:uncharacterized protein LOC112881191 n=1 Tax=Panicum hallii TaxID=206008 RepID=UPI000DF4CB3A|nr:uncharacterized protein LOC112881191 [Panicum hallii]
MGLVPPSLRFLESHSHESRAFERIPYVYAATVVWTGFNSVGVVTWVVADLTAAPSLGSHAMPAASSRPRIPGEEAKDTRQGRSINELAFQADEQTSLVNAAKIKNITCAGLHGFEVVNPELLDCKNRTKMSLEEAYEQMFEACMAQCNEELLTVEAHIASLKRSLAIPKDQIPHMGPAVNEIVLLQVLFEPNLSTKH